MRKIIAFDPGGSTGWACTYDGPTHHIQSGQIETEKHHMELYMFLLTESPDVIVCESFDYRMGAVGVQAELISREYIGVIELYSQIMEKDLIMQPPSIVNGKAHFWNKAKLQQLVLWKANAPHAMDATGHLLHYISKTDDYFIRKLRP